MNTRIRLLVPALLVALAVALTATTVFAALGLVKTSTKTKGATTITWDSSFADFGYTLGDTINMTVNWNVDVGAAEFESFGLRCETNNGTAHPNGKENGKGKGCPNFTPRSKKDPAEGGLPDVTLIDDSNDDDDGDGIREGTVKVEFKFTGLHLDRRRNVDLGNAHFKLYLMIDKDGDGTPETRAGYGVNVHVEDPQ